MCGILPPNPGLFRGSADEYMFDRFLFTVRRQHVSQTNLRSRNARICLMRLFRAIERALYVGDVALRLGTPRDATMKALLKYDLLAVGESGFVVRQCDQLKKTCDILGSIVFENNQLSEISRSIDTSGWPNDEGFSVARGLYDAINSSIDTTDNDGAKRANATIVISNQDADKPVRGNVRTINVFIHDRKLYITMWDGADGRSVSAQVTIRSKPW